MIICEIESCTVYKEVELDACSCRTAPLHYITMLFACVVRVCCFQKQHTHETHMYISTCARRMQSQYVVCGVNKYLYTKHEQTIRKTNYFLQTNMLNIRSLRPIYLSLPWSKFTSSTYRSNNNNNKLRALQCVPPLCFLSTCFNALKVVVAC